MIETRDIITAKEVLHITLDRKPEVVGQDDVRTISDDGSVLELHWQFVVHAAVQHVHIIICDDSLRVDDAASIDLHQSISSDNTDKIRGDIDREVSVLEVTCY